MTKTAPAVPFESAHNHRACIRSAMKAAIARCEEEKLRLTPLRRRVLELIWDSHRPATAYELLGRLRDEKENAEPPTVYRALDFLIEHHMIHRIESLNAYIGCDQPHAEHISQFMICSNCQRVAELGDTREIDAAVDTIAKRLGFEVSDRTVEISGLCQACRKADR